MQVSRASIIPLLVSPDRVDPTAFCDEGPGDLAIVYTFGPEFGRRLVGHQDLDQLQLPPRGLRQTAYQHLEVMSSRAEFHGQPPALMLSFDGLESSLLLASDFWRRLEGAVPGELVVGVPSRDCVVVTGSQSGPGLEKARKCVERLFFAGGEHLLTRSLLVRRGGAWEPFDRPGRPGGHTSHRSPAHQHGVGQPPRQFQEHPSWPGQQVPPQHTGSMPRVDTTGSMPRLDRTGSVPRMGIGGPIPAPPVIPTSPGMPAIPTQAPSPFSTGTHSTYSTGTQPAYSTGTQPAIPVSGTGLPGGDPASSYKPGPYSPPVLRRDDELSMTGAVPRITTTIGGGAGQPATDRYGYARREQAEQEARAAQEAYEREQYELGEKYEREAYEQRERERRERDRLEREPRDLVDPFERESRDRLDREPRDRDLRDPRDRDRLDREPRDRDAWDRDRDRLDRDPRDRDRLGRDPWDRVGDYHDARDRDPRDRDARDRDARDRDYDREPRERDLRERDRYERDRYEQDRYEQDRYERDRLERERESRERDRLEREREVEQRRPVYPAAWGSAPEDPTTQQFRTGPRARFAR